MFLHTSSRTAFVMLASAKASAQGPEVALASKKTAALAAKVASIVARGLAAGIRGAWLQGSEASLEGIQP